MPPAPSATTNTSLQAAPAARRGILLIVDDEEGPRQSLRVIFKDDYELLMAADGATAIALAKQHDPDVAVCDIRMAGMSGIEVLERLKYVDPAIEVVMITAFETTDTLHQALRLRASEYINKPFDVASIRSAVAKAMQRRTLESATATNTEKHGALQIELQNYKLNEQIAKTRNDIYAGIIHDINGPLSSISGFVEILNRHVSKTPHLEALDLEFFKNRLTVITRQVTNCIEISRRYLSLLRQQPDDAPQMGMNQILSDLERFLRPHPSSLHNQLTVHPLAEDIGARILGTDLIQILLNLGVNAFQCAPHGCQVAITGEILHQPLDLTMFKEGAGDRWLNIERFANIAPLVRLSVCDNGPGIPPEILPKIFQPYFSTKGPRQGTGLGLSIVHRLIRDAATALHVHTRVNEGSTFTLYIPAVPLAK